VVTDKSRLSWFDRAILIVLAVAMVFIAVMVWMGAGIDVRTLSRRQDDLEGQVVRLDAREQLTANTITSMLVDVRQRLERIDAKMSE
jgi:hypothetical protein